MNRISLLLLTLVMALSACEPRRNPLEPPPPSRPDDPLEPRSGALNETEARQVGSGARPNRADATVTCVTRRAVV